MRKAKNIARAFIRAIVDITESKKSMALEKLRIRFKADTKTGEAFVYNKTIFIIPDVTQKENLFKGQVDKDGTVLDAKKTDLEAYETFISSIENPERILVKIKTIESIKDVVGEEIEIMW